jgi:hypothetical protein
VKPEDEVELTATVNSPAKNENIASDDEERQNQINGESPKL